MHSPEFSLENKNNLKKFEKKKLQKINLIIMGMRFKTPKNKGNHLPVYYRLALAIYSQIFDKIIYLDGYILA